MKQVFTKLLFAVIVCAFFASCSNGEGYPDKAPAPKRRLLVTKADSLQAQRDQAAALEADHNDDN
jgi:hypothetical protein